MVEKDDVLISEIYKLKKDIMRLNREIERRDVTIYRLERIIDRGTTLADVLLVERELDNTKKLLEVFKKFVPTEFLSVLVEDPFKATLGNQVKLDLFVLFSDIRGFTSISESLSAEDTIKFLNDYLGEAEGPIINNHGFVDKYIGDAIMALFSNADDAIKAAIDLQRVARAYNKNNSFSLPFKIGIGIHTGELMLGIVGAASRMQSTVIGDPVNIASRLDGLSSIFNAPIIASEDVIKGSNIPNAYSLRNLGYIKLKGKITANKVFEVIDGESEDAYKKKADNKNTFEEALELFVNKQFLASEKLFRTILDRCPDDAAALFYLNKCQHYKIVGPPEGWDGSEQLVDK